MTKVSKYVTTLNKSQQRSLKALYDRKSLPITYRQFRKRVHINALMDCAMIQWCGMWIGIELDGYMHS